jgi:hypothetical protein
MAEMKTGQIDKLIDQKVNNQIDTFVRNITDQISTFLKENGDFDGSYLYVPDEWSRDHNNFRTVKELRHDSMSDVRKGLTAGLRNQVKDKMIARATKDLLDKVSLLS